jgi:hypothetical protein
VFKHFPQAEITSIEEKDSNWDCNWKNMDVRTSSRKIN